MRMNLAICISGGGTTMHNVLIAHKNKRLPLINPALIISSRPDAGGIEKALKEGISGKDIVVIDRKRFKSSDDFGEAIIQECRLRKVDLIAQCGFIPLMPSIVIQEYRSMIFNQHPGPLDQDRLGFGGKGMYGKSVHHAVIYFAKRVGRHFLTEATAHRVTDTVDGGALLGIRKVDIMEDDDAFSLAARVLPQEHKLVIEMIDKFSREGKLCDIRRNTPLIRENEKDLLIEAKKAGIEAFPNG